MKQALTAPDSALAAARPAGDAAGGDVQSVATGVRLRVLVPLALVIVSAVVAFLSILVFETQNRQAEDIQRTAAAVEHMFHERSRTSVELMQSLLEQVVRNGQVESALRARDSASLLAFSAPLFANMQARHAITHFYYVLPDGTVLLRVHAPDHAGDKIDRLTFAEARRTGKPFWGNEQGTRGNFTLRLVQPWFSKGELIGYVELGIEFEDIMRSVKAFLDVDVFVAMEKALFNRSTWEQAQASTGHPISWDEFPAVLLMSRTAAVVPPPVRAYLAGLTTQHVHRPRSFEVAWDRHTAQAIVVPFTDLHGQPVGEMVAVRDVTAAVLVRHRATIGVAIAGTVVGGGLLLSFYFLLGRVQRDVAQRTARLAEAQRVLAAEQFARQRAQRDLGLQQERNELLEARGRMVEELGAAKMAAETALRMNEEITRELRQTQGQLLASARQAGMAEIATSVLHNVGNVLNSVNVSANLVTSTLRSSRGQGLSRAVQLLNEHAADLGAYLTTDPRGKLVPAYLDSVAQALAAERTAIMAELEHLTRSIDHIKAVVATQQSHAGAGGIIEPVLISGLAEDALRMNGSSLSRHGVTVERRFGAIPPVRVDRARVLQILVNLISNAKQAVRGVEGGGRITITVEALDGAVLRVTVEDNGEGIPPENITRIFAHGFTTRKEGHGFGLHSSALAARTMGGDLTARSDGPGRGATFTLDLPMDRADGGAPA